MPGLNPGHERNTVADTPGFAKMAQVYGAYTAAFLLLLAGGRRRAPAWPSRRRLRMLSVGPPTARNPSMLTVLLLSLSPAAAPPGRLLT